MMDINKKEKGKLMKIISKANQSELHIGDKIFIKTFSKYKQRYTEEELKMKRYFEIPTRYKLITCDMGYGTILNLNDEYMNIQYISEYMYPLHTIKCNPQAENCFQL